jgi:phenylalanyl-tRNA synthetase beta chain
MPSGGKLPDEITQLSAVYLKGSESTMWQGRHEGFYDLKGALDNIFTNIKISHVSFVKDHAGAEMYLHPGKSSTIIVDNEKIGCIGVLHPRVADAFDIKGDITIAEIYDITKILNKIPSETTFFPLPRYPYVERDVAFIVNNDITVSAVRDEILVVQSDIIEAINLFDIYKGKPVPKDKKSLAFSIRYRSADRTLTDSEVDELHSEIINRLKSTLNAEMRE